jgi:hypothetical protein
VAHRGSFNALLFLLLALLLILAPTLAQSQAAYSGTWNGRTAQHEPITLIIEGRTLRAVIVRVHIHGSEPAHCTGEVLFIASNYDTGMYYINNSEIDLFWEEDGAQLALQAFIDQGRAYGTLHLQTTPGEYPPPLCHGTGRANFSAGIGVPYESGRPSSPTSPPPAAPAPPVATAPAAPAAPVPTARPGEPQAPTTRPTRTPQVQQPTATPQQDPTNTVVPGTIIGDTVSPPWWPCEEGQVKGNRNTMIYHVRDGQFYDKTYEDVECFNTEAEALAAGYRRSER